MLQRIFLMFSGVSGTFVFSFPGNFIHINFGCFPVGVGFLQGTALQPWPQGEGWQPNQTGLQYCFFFFLQYYFLNLKSILLVYLCSDRKIPGR